MSKLDEIEQGKITEMQKRYVLFTYEITAIIHDTIRDTEEAVKKEFIEGKRCLQCGNKKEAGLTDMCDKCLED